MRWFVCKVIGMEVWVKATSHSKARYKCLRAAWEAGYYQLTFKDVRVLLDRSGLTPIQDYIL